MAPCNALLVVRFENPAPHPQLSKGGAAKYHLETFHKCLHQSIPQLGGHVLTAVHTIIRTSDYPFQSGWQGKVLLVQFESTCPKQEAKLALCSSFCIGRVKLGLATSQQTCYLQHAPAEKLHHHLWLLRHPVEGLRKKGHLVLQQSFIRINVSWQVRNGYFNKSRIIGFPKTHRGYSDSRVQPPTNEMQKSGWSSMINGIQRLMSSTNLEVEPSCDCNTMNKWLFLKGTPKRLQQLQPSCCKLRHLSRLGSVESEADAQVTHRAWWGRLYHHPAPDVMSVKPPVV